jgi:hypothetical protein
MAGSTTSKPLRLLADAEVELPLVIRYGLFGLACCTYFSFMLVCNQWVQTPEGKMDDFFLRALEDATYWLPGFLLLAPLAFNDFIKSCGRVSRPIVRLRNEVQLLIDHKSERPIEIKDGEAWAEVLAGYNQLRGELLTLRREVSEYEAMLGQVAIGSLQQLPADEPPTVEGQADQPDPQEQPAIESATH